MGGCDRRESRTTRATTRPSAFPSVIIMAAAAAAALLAAAASAAAARRPSLTAAAFQSSGVRRFAAAAVGRASSSAAFPGVGRTAPAPTPPRLPLLSSARRSDDGDYDGDYGGRRRPRRGASTSNPLPPPPVADGDDARRGSDDDVDDTLVINAVGTALPADVTSEAAAESAAASVLAIDPSAIEIVPVESAAAAAAKKAAAAAEAVERRREARDLIQPDNGTEALLFREADSNGRVAGGEAAAAREEEAATVVAAEEAAARLSAASAAAPDFVKMFRGSAPYIANHRGTLVVYHVPGELLEWEGFSDLMDDIALTWLLGTKIVLVCGCRHQIDRRMEETGNDDPIRHSSIRVTDANTLRVVKEEAGYVRFEVERQLARALRVHGGGSRPHGRDSSPWADGNVVSGNFYSAQPFGVIDGVDYMYTGFPRRVESEKIRQVHASNDIVLLTPLGVSPSGEIFNVNSESLAANAAGALGASKVIYFAVRGTALVKRESDGIVQNLRLTDARNLLQHYRVRIHKRGFASVDDRGIEDEGEGGDGDGPSSSTTGADGRPTVSEAVRRARSSPAVTEALLKIGWATSALERGVKRAHIIAPTNGALLQELYTRDGSGTLISRDLYEGIRPADVNDVAGIYDLIDPLVRMGTLVPRPKSVMEKDIRSYYVYTRDDLIVATGQLKRFEDGHAEIGCLVVSRDYRSQGRGDAMLGYLERLCLQCGASKVFVLSTQTMEWFVERGFREVGVDALPPSRRAVYNYNRRSKIYMKKIDGDRDLDAAELWWNR